MSSDQKKKGDLPNTWKDGSGMLTNGPLVRYYVHISVPLPQHKCFDLVRYFFRVPPCPPLRPGFFLSQVRIPYLVETTLCHGKGTVILVFFGEEP